MPPARDRRNERNQDQTRINNNIRERQVRVISAEGEQLGILPIDAALERAQDVGLDLVEVAANSKPPVCRIMDYGKYKYEKSKKKQSSSSGNHGKLKEIRLRPKTGEHDIDFKVKQAVGFLKHKDKVQVSVIFRGREMAHIEEGRRVMEGVLEELLQYGKLDSEPQQLGKRMMATVSPK
ncbi:MAG: translation initiation factor IF-3 [Planctomycetota bacterium]